MLAQRDAMVSFISPRYDCLRMVYQFLCSDSNKKLMETSQTYTICRMLYAMQLIMHSAHERSHLAACRVQGISGEVIPFR